LQAVFYNELWEAVSGYLEQNCISLNVFSRSVHTIDHAELSDINVKCVYVENLPGMKIAFDVILEAEFEISETDRHADRYAEKHSGSKYPAPAIWRTALMILLSHL